jgi:hypothetical protein
MNPDRSGAPVTDDDIDMFPSVRAGRGRSPDAAVEAWVTAGWLLAVEGRAYLEDLAGGTDQPDLRQAVRLKLLDLLCDVDHRLTGTDVVGGHQLALALEYGLREVAVLSGGQVVDLFGPDGTDDPDELRLVAFWAAVCAAFPGELPDPLQPSGQGQILRALRNWSKLCAATGSDAGFLEPLVKDA